MDKQTDIDIATAIYKLDGSERDADCIRECARIIRNGGTVVFPTETVYGVGANAFDETACAKIYAAKRRPADKALLCHLFSLEQAEEIAYLTDGERKLISAFTPGPLTVIADKKSCIGDIVSAKGTTVGLRFPSNREALMLMKETGLPIAATSANISSCPAPTDAAEVIETMYGRVDAILDCGVTGNGTPSTIVSLSNGLKILRQGSIGEDEIKAVLEGG